MFLRDSHGWVPCGSGADPKTERSLGHSVAGKKQLKSWYLFLVAQDRMVVYHLNLDVAGTDILCVFGSRLMVGFFKFFLSDFGGSFTDARFGFAVSVFISIPNGGAPSLRPIGPPKAQPRHRGILQASVASSPCPRTWENCQSATKNSRFSHLSVNMVGNQSSIVPRDVKNCCGFTNESLVLRSLLYDKFAERKAQQNPFQLFFGFQSESGTFSLPCYSEREIIWRIVWIPWVLGETTDI